MPTPTRYAPNVDENLTFVLGYEAARIVRHAMARNTSLAKWKPRPIARYFQSTEASWSPKTRSAWKKSPIRYSVRAWSLADGGACSLCPHRAGEPSRPTRMEPMAQGHSVDEYLETIYFLAFPIGEYRPQ